MSELDSYVSSLKANQATLADYLSDDNDSSSSDGGLYSVLTYGQSGQIQNIIRQAVSQNTVSTDSSTSTATKTDAAKTAATTATTSATATTNATTATAKTSSDTAAKK